MRKTLLFYLFWVAFLPLQAQEKPAFTPAADTTRQVLELAEVNPEFPGGQQALLTFLKDNLVYEKDPDLPEGLVVVSFVVTETGAINDIIVLKPLHRTLAIATVRAVKQMPNWNPGKNNGQPVAVRYNLPVRFSKPPAKSKTKVKRKN